MLAGGRYRADRGQFRCVRGVSGVLAHRSGVLLRRGVRRHVARARHQRHLHGRVLPAGRPRGEVRAHGGRADEHPTGRSAHHGGCRRRAGAHCLLPCFQRVQPGVGAGLGRAHGHRHRLRPRHSGACSATACPAAFAVFLSTLAVADDIIAILVIAVFYGHSPSLLWLAGAAVRARGARSHESQPYLLPHPVSGCGTRAVVLRVHVGRAFHHRRRAAGVRHPVGIPRELEELHRLVGHQGAGGARDLRARDARHRTGRIHRDRSVAQPHRPSGGAPRDTTRTPFVPVGVFRHTAPVCTDECRREFRWRRCGRHAGQPLCSMASCWDCW